MNSTRAAHFVEQEKQCASLGDRNGATRCVRQAIDFAEHELTVWPEDVDAAAFLGSCYLKLGQLAEAEASYRRAANLKPMVAPYHQNLGQVLLRQAKYEEAEASLRKALALDPAANAQTFSGLAQILARKSEKRQAAALLRRASECEADGARAKFYLARACFHEGDLTESEKALREAIQLGPRFTDPSLFLAQIMQQQGQFAEAEDVLNGIIRTDPKCGEAYKVLTSGRKITDLDRPLIGQMRAVMHGGQMAIAHKCALHYALAKALDDLVEYESALEQFDEANATARMMLHEGPLDRQKLQAVYTHAAATFSKDFFAKHCSLGSESDMPILIVGMWRSGTTLVEQIVSSHPEVGAGDELPFWIKEGSKTMDPSRRYVDERGVREVQDDYLGLLQSLGPNKARVTDKRPGNYGMLGLIHLAFPRAKILHCVRDPVDTALSLYMTHSTVNEFGHARENIVFGYKEYAKLMKFYKSVLPPDSILDVQYEELVADKEPVTRRIIEFLGLEWSDACLHHELNARTVSTPSRWQARQPIYASSVRRWKNYEPWLGVFKELIKDER